MAVVALSAGALFAWSGGIEIVVAGADAVRDKFTGVRTLKPQCRKAQTVAETVREVMKLLEAQVDDLTEQPPPALVGPIKMIREALAEIEKVLDICTTRPVRAKLFSNTYVQKLRSATSQIHDAITLIGGVHAGVSLEMQREARDAKHELKDAVESLALFKDTIGDELKTAVKESLGGGKANLPALIAKFEREGLVASSRDAVDQLRQLQHEADELRTLKAFAEQELIDAVCRLSLRNVREDEVDAAIAQGEAQTAADTKLRQPGFTRCKSGIVVPGEFKCPLTLDLMEEPVLLFTESGGTFERRALEQYLSLYPTRDPLTGLDHAAPLSFAPNRSLKDAITKWYDAEIAAKAVRRASTSSDDASSIDAPEVSSAGTETSVLAGTAVAGCVAAPSFGTAAAAEPGAARATQAIDDALASLARSLPASDDDAPLAWGTVLATSKAAEPPTTPKGALDESKEETKEEMRPESVKDPTSSPFDLKNAAALALSRQGTPEARRPKALTLRHRSMSADTNDGAVDSPSSEASTSRSASETIGHRRSRTMQLDSVVGDAASVLLDESTLRRTGDKPGPRSAGEEAVAAPQQKRQSMPRLYVPAPEAAHRPEPKQQSREETQKPDVAILVRMLRMHGPEQESAAADLLKLVSKDVATARNEIARANGIDALCHVIEKGQSDDAKASAAKILQIASMNNDATKCAIALAGGIYPLAQLVAHGVTEASRGAAAGALANLAPIDDNQIAITTSGGIQNLVGLLDAASPSSEAASMAAAALRNLAAHGAWNQTEIARCGGIAPLCEKLDEGRDSTKEACAAVLKRLTSLPSSHARAEIARSLGVHGFFGATPSKSKVDACIDKKRRATPVHRRSSPSKKQ
mmetsp:Transcript_20241/g.63619  ORF Transcript_20241/g.63619 Transcript_20241/m.63619 type:complete len:869 (-) Transcript_20241:363-2969(-)|eukprot:CAMPEP_0197394544 /NCGR_PEP_ID=MMETSP1165-20131217/5433_1 /TAXON_ID=284809 /ORGANISM="Chrysocystis fragilis, Strain CCMP3189" /LENGTH=868 /DNA_ID=CAMNT_0042920261 /DNA_START=187 /DNA_END=2793 /DNA_ORIENTATION=+